MNTPNREHDRANEILSRMENKETIGFIDTIYIYLWVFAVTEWGLALKATMWVFALTVLFMFPVSLIIPNVFIATALAFVLAFCIVVTLTTFFGFVIMLIILPIAIMIVFAYMLLRAVLGV